MPSPIPTLVNIGTHSLVLYAHGPATRTSSDPVLIFIPGVASSRLVWAAVLRLLPPHIRSYTYDRSGCGQSSISPLSPIAENIAHELKLLITNAGIKNPVVLVGHSWAGILIRELVVLLGLGHTGDDEGRRESESEIEIAGLVLVDANQEDSLRVLNVLDADLEAVFASKDPYRDMGIEAEHKLSSAEWDAFIAEEATAKFTVQAAREEAEYEASFRTLRKKKLALAKGPVLDDRPVAVVGGFRSRDWRGLYKAGVERGNGSEEQRERVRVLIEGADEKHMSLIQGHLGLSSKNMLVWARESGHFVQLTQPDVVVEGVEWVLNQLRAGGKTDR